MKKCTGFTLIELSIVIVIIGLVVGGIVVGRELIKGAEIRAMLSQKDRYMLAVNIFKQKYNAIPGNMLPTQAAQFSFFAFTGINAGKTYFGSGNGLIAGWPEVSCFFECGAFWAQLSDAELIEPTGATLFDDTSSGCTGVPTGELCWNQAQAQYMPKSKYGKGYFGVSGIAYSRHFWRNGNLDQTKNMFYLGKPAAGTSIFEPNMSAAEAYSIDLKMDDGNPNTGKFLVSVYRLNNSPNFFSVLGLSVATYWSATTSAGANICTFGGANAYDTTAQYNSDPANGGDNSTCIPAFVW